MSDTPWTPAPWEHQPKQYKVTLSTPDKSQELPGHVRFIRALDSELDVCFLIDGEGHEEATEADAQLIALAPEMAAAIEAWARASDVRGTNEQEDEASLLLGEVAMELRQIRKANNE